eukprot:1150910-Pelagomonas_calceolata.AAC.4
MHNFGNLLPENAPISHEQAVNYTSGGRGLLCYPLTHITDTVASAAHWMEAGTRQSQGERPAILHTPGSPSPLHPPPHTSRGMAHHLHA